MKIGDSVINVKTGQRLMIKLIGAVGDVIQCEWTGTNAQGNPAQFDAWFAAKDLRCLQIEPAPATPMPLGDEARRALDAGTLRVGPLVKAPTVQTPLATDPGPLPILNHVGTAAEPVPLAEHAAVVERDLT